MNPNDQLPTESSKEKKARPKGGALVCLLLLLAGLEFGALYYWYHSKSSELSRTNAQAHKLEGDLRRLQRKKQLEKQMLAANEQTWQLLERQNQRLRRLVESSPGPHDTLMYLSYAMTQPPDTRHGVEERKALEHAGWNLQWNPDTVWLTRLEEKQRGILTIEGEAMSHRDVLEFLTRLGSCAYFWDLRPGRQEEKYDQDVELSFVEFEATVKLNYRAQAAAEEAGDE